LAYQSDARVAGLSNNSGWDSACLCFDVEADLAMAQDIAFYAKFAIVWGLYAMETLLVHADCLPIAFYLKC